jgi:hypothetical protein
MAAGSADAAEMAQVQRMAPVCPPLHIGIVDSADEREDAAENAKAVLPQRHKEHREDTERWLKAGRNDINIALG